MVRASHRKLSYGDEVILRSHPAALIPNRGKRPAKKAWHHEYLCKHSIFDGQGGMFQTIRSM